ncbi:hypothetical protein [Haloarcula rubripromontorii]|uniref:hypothetical protein n=1 Tax=Haloarcula rubripromontorii TaxID=1705562 RepID=UPI00345B5B0D
MIGEIVEAVRSVLGRDQSPTIKQADDRFPGDFEETLRDVELFLDEGYDAGEAVDYVVAHTMDTGHETIEEEEQVGTTFHDHPKYDTVEKHVVTFARDDRELVIYDGDVEVRGGEDENGGVDEEQSSLDNWGGQR